MWFVIGFKFYDGKCVTSLLAYFEKKTEQCRITQQMN